LKLSTRTYAATIIACLAVTLFCLIYPIYVIRPFRGQGAQELIAALLVVRYRPVIAAACVLVSLVAAARYWRLQPRLWKKIGAVIGTVAVVAVTVLSRVNVYELMFHPMGAPAFESAAESKLDKDEMVVAVQVSAVSRAYPIRSMSYHHIVNDTVGGVPIVATY
jgi:hypothetical protein